MLGLSKKHGERAWRFAAAGKHPVAKDFLSIGQVFPLAGSLADWMVRGYAGAGEPGGRSACFWRFWMRGGGRDQIACGLLRGSCDSIGRPYPFLVLGAGPAPGWEQNWDRVPSACAGTWQQMEKLCCGVFTDVSRLEQGVLSLKAPATDWGISRDAAGPGRESDPEPDPRTPPCLLRDQGYRDAEWLALPATACADPAGDAISRAGRILRDRSSGPPTAAFIGGSPGAPRYAVFRRPLKRADFTRLWSEPALKEDYP